MEWNKDFSDNYVRVYGNRFNQAMTDKQAAFVASKVIPRGRIADVPCGYGRHAEALAKMGFTVHGVDLYNTPKETRPDDGITYEVADMRTWRGKDFDAVISMFSSFGYFSHEENEKVLENAIASVKKGGVIIIDNRNPVTARREFETNNWQSTGTESGEHSTFDPQTNIETIYYTVDGKEIYASWRHYTLEEFNEMFKKYGCTIKATYGRYGEFPYIADESQRMIVVAIRQ